MEDDIEIVNCEYCGDLVVAYEGVRANHECDEAKILERTYEIWRELEQLMGDGFGKWRVDILSRKIDGNGDVCLKGVVHAASGKLCELKKAGGL